MLTRIISPCLLPLTRKLLEPETLPTQDVQQKLINSRQKQAFYYNLKGKALPELQPGQTVRMKKPNESTWTEAVCKKMIGPRSYVVVSGNRTYRRNQRQLRSAPPSEPLSVNLEQQRDTGSGHLPSQDALPKDVARSGDTDRGQLSTKDALPKGVTRSGRTINPPVHFQDYTT